MKKKYISFLNDNRVVCGLIFLSAFIIRFIYLEQIKTNPFFTPHSLDPLFYHNWALQIANGDWIGGNSVFKGLPLYAYFLAGVYKVFGANVYIPRLANILFGSLTCIFIYILGKKVFDKKTALLASLLAVFYKPFIFYEGIIDGVTLAVLLTLLSLFMALRFFHTLKTKDGVCFGVLIGITCLCRPAIIMFPFLSFLFAYIKYRDKKIILKNFVCFLIGLFSILSITGIRNFIAGKDFVLITAHSGLNFYIGNNIDSTGKFHAPLQIGRQTDKMMDNAKFLAEKDTKRTMKFSEVSDYYKKKAYGFILRNPISVLKLYLKKTYLFWQGGEITDFGDITFYKRFSALLRVPMVSFFLIVPWALMGIFLSFRINGGLSVIRYFVASYFFATIMYFVNSRYRMPVVPVLLIFASYAVFYVIQSYKNIKKVLYISGCILILYVILGVNMEKPRLADDYNELASWYVSEKKDFTRAVALFKEAHKMEPDNQYVVFNLARTYFDYNKFDESLEYFKKAVALDRYDYESYNFIGIVLSQTGRLSEAIPFFEKSFNINPDYYLALNNMASNYNILGNQKEAGRVWEKSLKINPDQPQIKENLSRNKY